MISDMWLVVVGVVLFIVVVGYLGGDGYFSDDDHTDDAVHGKYGHRGSWIDWMF